jgi:hypothetical protein
MGKVGIPGISSAPGIVAVQSEWHTEIPDSGRNSGQNMSDVQHPTRFGAWDNAAAAANRIFRKERRGQRGKGIPGRTVLMDMRLRNWSGTPENAAVSSAACEKTIENCSPDFAVQR